MRLRYIPLFFLLVTITFSLLSNFIIPVKATASLVSCENEYKIDGVLCYNDLAGAFVGSYSVEGRLELKLTPTGPDSMQYEITHYLKNVDADSTLIDASETGELSSRMKPDGNYTEFLSTMSHPTFQKLGTLSETVEAQGIGIRFIHFQGKWIRTQCYLFTRAELTSIFRCQWFFDPETGVLLRLYKSIEINLFKVQWIEYLIENTSLSFDMSAGPMDMIFTNQLSNIFATIGAIGVSLIFTFYIIQKKAGRVLLD